MKLPPGFELEEDTTAISLPPGFELEGEPTLPEGFELEEPAGIFSRETLAIPFAAVGNTADRALSGIAQGAASLFGDDTEAENIGRNLQERVSSRTQWANPENKEQTFGSKAAGMAATLPMQMVAMGLSPAETGQTLLDNGETLSTARKAAAIDFAGNTAGMFIPGGVGSSAVKRAITGGAINAAQDTAVRASIAGVAEQEASKKQFAPTMETAALAVAPGAAFGALSRPVSNPRNTAERLNNLRAIAEQEQATQNTRNPIPDEAQMELPLTNEVAPRAGDQRGLFDEPDAPVVRDVEEATTVPKNETEAVVPKEDADPVQRALLEDNIKVLDNSADVSVPREGVQPKATVDVEASTITDKTGQTFDVSITPKTFGVDQKTPNSVMVEIRDPKTGDRRGFVDFAIREDGTLTAENAMVAKQFRQRGLSEAMYTAVREAGYNIEPGRAQTEVGAKMVESLKSKGLISVPRGQRGGLDFQAIAEGFAKLAAPLRTRPVQQTDAVDRVNSIIARQKATGIQPDPLVSSVVAKQLGSDTQGANRSFSAGATLEALKRRSPLIEGVGDIVQNFGKRSEKWVRENIFPVEREFRKLAPADLVELNAVMKQELETNIRYTPEQLAQAGFSEKQIRSHRAMRELFDNVLRIQNEGRAAQGKEPITGIEAYHAARWDGDFGVELKNSKGEVVWKVRANTKKGAMLDAKRLMKKVPDLVIGREFDRLNARGVEANDLQSAYTTMIDLLGRDNPVVKDIRDLVEAEAAGQGNAALANTQHFKKKSGMRGYVGDRPWMNPEKDAKQFFQQQIQYAKNASKWSEIQKAMPNLKELLSNEELIAKNPEQVKWAQDYVQNALGFGENKAVRMVENELGKTFGISPKAVGDAIGGLKFVWITQKLMMSAGYNAVQAIQLVNTSAWHSDLSAKGYKHNPLSTGIMGLIAGLQLGTVHTIDGVRGRQGASKLAALPSHLKAALEYAENNSVTNRSSYDETPVGQGNAVSRGISKTVSLMDTYTRGVAFMSFVQHLHESGRFGPEQQGQMFKMAEDYTNASMGDARNTEKAPIFSRMGLAGNAFNTLQTFNVNWFNQWSYFSRELARGNPRPFFTGLVVQGLIGGVMGLPLVTDLDKAWEYIKTTLPTDVWNKVKDWSVKSILLDKFGPGVGEHLTYGSLSAVSDIGFNTRVSAPSLIDAPGIPGGMLVDLYDQLTSVAKATAAIDDPVKWSQAALNVSPPGVKEFVAQTLLEEYTQVVRKDGKTIPFSRKDIMERGKGVGYGRTPEEQKLARTGLKSLGEVVQSDVLYREKKIAAESKLRQEALLDSMYSDVRNDKNIKDKLKLYQAIGGNVDSVNQQLEKRVQEEFMTAQEKMASDPKQTIRSMLMLKKLKEMEDARKPKQTAAP